jgi:tetratricopeptide (TPR) repeat protein
MDPAALAAVLRVDQRERWQAGERVLAEAYLQKYPSVRSDPESAVDLIYNEFRLREQQREEPTLDEYRQRFPDYATVLSQQIELHLAMAAASGAESLSSDLGDDKRVTGSSRARPEVPGYEILGELGRGGMGVVYRARQVALDRQVALKVILAGVHADPEMQRRFRSEAEAVARLRHPNFVQVHDYGVHGGCPYLVLELVDGGTLAQKAAGVAQACADAARVVATLAAAVHHAHEQGLIHRDLKPANVLLTAEGVLKITDLGLAKRLGGGPSRTASGALLGTPTYMAPEQVSSVVAQSANHATAGDGPAPAVGPAADVYALGVILYELVTGRPPLQGNSALELLRRVQEEEPWPPGRLRPDVPRDLETICLKCLEKVPGRRYASAAALADDLGRFLAGEPIHARPVGVVARTWRWCRRKPLVASLAGALGLIVIGSLVGLTRLYLNADAQRRRAEGAEESLQKAADEARQGEMKARQSEAQTKAVLDFFQKRVLAAARPKGQHGGLGRDATIQAAVEQAEPGVAEAFAQQPVVEASIRQALGHTYWFWGEYPLAIRQHARALALRRANLGPDDPETLKSMVSLAQDYEAAGRQADALQLYQETLQLCEARSGPNDPETLWSMKGVGDAMVSAGRLEEATALYEEALRRAKTALEPDHADTLIYMDKLANAYRLAGRLNEAVPLFEDTLQRERAQPKLGPDHPNTLVTMNNLAVAYSAAGRFDEAAALLRETLTRMKAVFSPEHRETLNSLTNLGKTYRDVGRLDEALPLLEEALRGKTAKLGPDHYLTLVSMGELATAYRMEGRLSEALAIFEDALRLQKVKFGADSPFRLTFMNQTGACLIQMKKFHEAELLLRECLALRMGKHPGEWEVFQTKSQLGQALIGLKRYAEAETLLQEAHRELAARKAVMPASFRGAIRETAQALVDLYKACGNHAQAARWQRLLADPSPP